MNLDRRGDSASRDEVRYWSRSQHGEELVWPRRLRSRLGWFETPISTYTMSTKSVEEYFKEMEVTIIKAQIVEFQEAFTKPQKLNLNLKGMVEDPTLSQAPIGRVRKEEKTSHRKGTKVLIRGVHPSKAKKKSGEIESESSQEETPIPSSEEAPCEGDLLMVRRLISILIGDDQSQRENTFHSRCLILGKCCLLIIDGESSVNVASQRLVSTKKKLFVMWFQWKLPIYFWENLDSMIERVTLKPLSPKKVLEDKIKMKQKRDEENKDKENDRKSRNKKKVKKNKSEHKSLLVSRKSLKKVFLNKKEPLLLLPTNMCFVMNSPLDNLPVAFEKMLEEFKHIFLKEMLYGLPPIRGIEHQIDFRANLKESKEIHKQVIKHLNKGLVRESVSLCVVLFILVPKKDDTWCMCMEYRLINTITTPISHLDDLLDEFHDTYVFSKIDLRSGYHQIRMEEGGEWKIAFKTKLGLYKCLIGKCVVLYFDDILIYSNCVKTN
ncbi:hypothetical protein CR513_01178, partial [Mucuna pruriens]